MRPIARARAALRRLDDAREPWTGPVIRLDPSSYQRPSVLLTWRCRNPFCRQWTMNGSYLTGRCNFCQRPRES